MGSSGKPQACHDCKRRKLKCDYRKPTCLRCENAEITCQGYQRETVFINSGFGNERLVPKHKNPSPTPPSFDDCLQELRSQLLEPTSSRSQLRNQSLTLLKKLYLPQPNPNNSELLPVSTWLPIVCCLQGTSYALDHSLYAFCVIQVAITKNGSISVDEAMRTYYDSLQVLKVELDDSNAAQKDEILAAISVLSTCELFVCPTDDAWQAHAQGISEIMRIRGGLDFSTPIQRSLYFRIRMILLFQALSKRLSRPTAASQCRQLKALVNEQDSMSELLDIAWQVPAVLEESDLLMVSSSTIPEHLRRCIFNPSLEMVEKLQDSQHRYRDELQRPPYWALPSTTHNPADEFYDSKLFPFALQFQSIETATHMVLYWAILLQVHCSIINLHLHLSRNTISSPASHLSIFDNPNEPLSDSRFATLTIVREEADKLARYLCQSIEFCYRIENGTLGPQLTCYAQGVLKAYFRQPNYERELAWCVNIKNMRGPGFHNGIELMCFEG
ncbi:hypothetical protein DL95DRAFT_395869 [Leptodontidium sp. 2 PMI_412]|nr:hypothetical protein DL95DRAFT_395869 [Leptodontidium sp. 2 PMI_412]